MDSDTGAEQAAVRALSRQVAQAAERVERLRSSIHLRLRSEYWFGERADAVRHSWETAVGPAMAENADLLRAMSRDMLGEMSGDAEGTAIDPA
jgi:hypothetical protein